MSEKRRKKRLKKTVVFVLLALVALAVSAGLLLFQQEKIVVHAFALQSPLLKVKEERSPFGYFNRINERRQKQMEMLAAVNGDFIGMIQVGQLFQENVVQCEDNEKYLKTDFEGNYAGQGTVFLDYRNTLEDQNLIVYGHYVYYDETAMFSPLHQLKEEANYTQNRIITLTLKEEIRKYEIAVVYYYEMGNPDLEYFHTDYGDRLMSYLEHIQEKAFYSTGVEIKEEDHLLTLQTCVRDREDLRLIVVAKQI